MACLWAATLVPVAAATYYVSPAGSDSHPGTLAQPFLTIDHALGQCVPGDEVVVRGGVYRDPIIPDRSGTQAAPITIRPFHDGNAYETVEIRGLAPIIENTGGAGVWQVHDAARNIYQIPLPAAWDLRVGAELAPSNQLFWGEQLLVEARWPNIASYAAMRETSLALGTGSSTGTANPYTGSYAAGGLGTFANNALVGATIVFNPGQRWFVLSGNVTANSASPGNVTFSFNRAPFNFGSHFPDAGDRFYLTKHLALLDAPGEWFFDHAGAHGPACTLYVRMPDNAPPSGRVLEMRRHDRFVDLSAASWLSFRHLKFTAAYVFGAATQHGFTFDGCVFREPGNGLGRNGIFLNGNNNTFINNTVIGSAGIAVFFRDSTSGNVVENNVVGDSHYLGGEGAAISIRGAQRVSRNTIFNAGGHGIHVLGQGARVQRNHVFHFGALVQDVGGINAFGGGDQGGAEWSHNLVHDGLAKYGDFPGNNGTIGIRIDNGESATACYNLVLHHNLTYGVTNSGLNVWGVKNSQLAASHTQANVNIRVFNNTCAGPAKMVGVAANTDYKFTGITWRNNIITGPFTSNRPEALTDALITDNLLAAANLPGNLAGSPSFVDLFNDDYRLTAGSPAVDAGAWLPPFTDDATGAAPDIGTLERGSPPWRAGAVVTAADLTALVLAYEGDNTFTLSGIPIGRTVPDGFAVRIGGSRVSSPDILFQTNSSTGSVLATLTIHVDGLAGSPSVEYSLDGVTYLGSGQSVNLSDTPSVIPAAPSHLEFYHQSNDRITLWWRDNSDNETGFIVQAATDPAFSSGLIAIHKSPGDNAHAFSGLTPDATWFFRVRATGAAGESPFSETKFATMGPVRWTLQHPDDDGFETVHGVTLNSNMVALNSTGAFRFGALTVPAGATITAANLLFTAAVTENRNTVKIRFQAENMDHSAPLTTAAGSIANRSKTTALVDWNNVPAWVAGEVSENQTTPDLKALIQAVVNRAGWQEGNALTILTADNGSTNLITRSVYHADDSLSRTTLSIRFTTGDPPAYVPAALVASTDGMEAINLSWSHEGAAQLGFHLERSTHPGHGYSILTSLPAAARNHRDAGLVPGVTYYYRLRPHNGGGMGPVSPTASATLPLPAPPAAPQGLTATALGTSAIQLNWSGTSTDETGFLIERSLTGTLGSFTALASVGAGTNTHIDGGLALGTRYFYRLRATNGVTHSTFTPVATAATASLQTIADNPTTAWYRGRTGSTPPSALDVQNTTELVHFTGGVAGSDSQYASFWRYFTPVTLADGDTLRLAVTFACAGTQPNRDRALRFGFFNSNGTQLTTNISGDNNPAQLDDHGYGIALATGTNTISRYLEDRAAETATAPLRNGWVNLGADTGSLAINDTADHSLVFELSRSGADLHVRATVDGALFDSGRIVSGAANFTFDMLLIGNRSSGLTWTIRNLAIQRSVPAPQLTALQAWRLANFATVAAESDAGDAQDPDADGLANLLEYALGSVPNDAASRAPTICQIDAQDRLQLTFTPAAVAGLRYHVQISPDLSDWSLESEITDLLTPGMPYTHTDDSASGDAMHRFLRLKVSPR